MVNWNPGLSKTSSVTATKLCLDIDLISNSSMILGAYLSFAADTNHTNQTLRSTEPSCAPKKTKSHPNTNFKLFKSKHSYKDLQEWPPNTELTFKRRGTLTQRGDRRTENRSKARSESSSRLMAETPGSRH